MHYNITEVKKMAKNSDYLEKKSLEYRKTVLEIIYNSGAGHT